MHVVKHLLCARFPNLFIAGMPEQAYADDNIADGMDSFSQTARSLLIISSPRSIRI